MIHFSETSVTIFDYIPSISTHPLFKGVDKNIISKYLCDNSIEVNNYTASEVIIPYQSTNVPIFVIVAGTVQIFSPNDSRKVLLKTSGAGTIFGIANLYMKDTHFPSTVIAKKQTTVLTISNNVFIKMLNHEPDLMNNYLAFLNNKIIYLNKKISSYTAGNNENKLLYFLSENEVDGKVSIDTSISDIAIMLDMGRASLYRALEKLEGENIIKRNGKYIVILDREKIKKNI